MKVTPIEKCNIGATAPESMQQVFDWVVHWFFGHRMPKSRVENYSSEKSTLLSGCKYRGVHGARCAAGVLIPDTLYSPALEGRGIDRAILASPDSHLLLEWFGAVPLNFLARLQGAHDTAGTAMEFRRNLMELADEYQLRTWPALDQFPDYPEFAEWG